MKKDYEPPKLVELGPFGEKTEHSDPLHPDHPAQHLTSSITHD